MNNDYVFHLWKTLPNSSWEDVHVEDPDFEGKSLCGMAFPNKEGCDRYHSDEEVFRLPLYDFDVKMCPECRKKYLDRTKNG